MAHLQQVQFMWYEHFWQVSVYTPAIGAPLRGRPRPCLLFYVFTAYQKIPAICSLLATDFHMDWLMSHVSEVNACDQCTE